METRALGKTGLQTSVLGFGAAPIGVLDAPQTDIDGVLNLLLDEGVNLIDTAANYASSEEAIGKAIATRRDEYILVSKCGQAFPDLKGEAWSAEIVRNTIDRSLKRLQTDYLDVMLLHSCELEILQQGDVIAALITARDAGKIRFAGYSGDNEAVAHAAELPELAVLETSVNICDQINIDVALPRAVKADLGVLAKRPIANAAWKPLGTQPGFYSQYAREYTQRWSAMNLTARNLGFAKTADSCWPEIALRFTLAQPGVHTAIIGTTRTAHATANIAAARKGPLPSPAVAAIRSAFQRAEAETSGAWRGLT
ncbi:MAG: aldo/keto reductase [Planctomycetaceae bacterium]|nr:aldo/keto reductase [Planctomycetaceae bacterium]